MRMAVETLTREQIATATLYTSCEPCAMCSGAMYWGGLNRMVYGHERTRSEGVHRRQPAQPDHAGSRMPQYPAERPAPHRGERTPPHRGGRGGASGLLGRLIDSVLARPCRRTAGIRPNGAKSGQVRLESAGISRNQPESAGISRNQPESAGISRNQPESLIDLMTVANVLPGRDLPARPSRDPSEWRGPIAVAAR